MEKGKLSADDIILVLDKLIGGVCATGDSGVDDSRLENLETMLVVSHHILSSIIDASNDKDSRECSVKKIGLLATKFLEEERERLEWYAK